MHIVSFVHQKGGTGKSTLSIALATSLAATGARVVLLDADYQGTSSDWGNRFGTSMGVDVRSQVQPIVHSEAARFAARTDWLVVDGPPGLSEMTQSLVQAGGRMIVPLRPALPDVWALPWLVAVIKRAQQAAKQEAAAASRTAAAVPLLVFNQHRGEDLAPLRAEASQWGVPVHGVAIPDDPAFQALYRGEPLPVRLRETMLGLVEAS